MASSTVRPIELLAEIELEPFVIARLYDIAREEGLTEGYKTETSRGSGAVADVVRVVLRGPRNGIPASKSLIVKNPPPSDKATHLNSIALFTAEVRAYEHLLKMFVHFQRAKGVSVADGFYNIPRCHSIACNSETQRYVLIMEDLGQQGYVVTDHAAPVTIAHARLVAKELGRFHGISLAISDQRPDLFEPYAKHENLLLADIERKPAIRQSFENALRGAIGVLEEQDAQLKLKVERALQNFMQHMRTCLHSKLDEPMRVIGHGDLWNNHLMFQHVNGQPTRVCLIDYKTTCFVSPVLDIINYLFVSTTKQFRDNYAEEVLREYHDALCKIVRKLGSDPNRLFNWPTFEREMIRFGIYNILVTPMQLQVSMADADGLRRYQDAVCSGAVPPNVLIGEDRKSLYEQRVRDVLRDADEWDFFPKT